jgi:hypothetical protein
MDEAGALFLEASLADELKLKKKFADVKLDRYPVIPRALDGDVLPGDPGWSGVFRPQGAG